MLLILGLILNVSGSATICNLADLLFHADKGVKVGKSQAAQFIKSLEVYGIRGLTLVIPVYNEQEALASALKNSVLAELGEGCEVILIDDSETHTQSMLEAFASDRCRILRHAENRGYGAALKTGVIAAAHDFIAITDADGTYPPES
jgi:cellulose synthase/poly-beta-1,6-N-acetylglucosamine synthase-like glycosyltransferase